MQRFRFPIAVAITSLALVSAIAVVGALTLPNAAAAAPFWMGGAGFGHSGPGGPAFTLPPELQGLGDVPPTERFAHFTGVQVSLKDKDNRPMTVHVTPGIATVASPTSLSVAANDGTTRTFALTDKTTLHGKPALDSGQRNETTVGQGDEVIVVTLNDDTTARLVLSGGKDGFGAGWSHGWGGWGNPANHPSGGTGA